MTSKSNLSIETEPIALDIDDKWVTENNYEIQTEKSQEKHQSRSRCCKKLASVCKQNECLSKKNNATSQNENINFVKNINLFFLVL